MDRGPIIDAKPPSGLMPAACNPGTILSEALADRRDSVEGFWFVEPVVGTCACRIAEPRGRIEGACAAERGR